MNENGSHDVCSSCSIKLKAKSQRIQLDLTTVLLLLRRNYILREDRELIFYSPADKTENEFPFYLPT